ncbi:hypothetical protein BH10BAC2_BH10BAC2_14230 [soil metagenome]
MATWQEAIDRVKAFRNYVKGLTGPAKDAAKYAYMIKTEDIELLLNQKGGGVKLNGIRVYIGVENIEGSVVPSLYIVAVEKDTEDKYNDYNVPDNSTSLTTTATLPLLGVTHPCPVYCSKTDILNS